MKIASVSLPKIINLQSKLLIINATISIVDTMIRIVNAINRIVAATIIFVDDEESVIKT